jgi:type II secretory pathway component PulM
VANDTAPWIVVALAGAVGGLFATLTQFVRSVIRRYETVIDTSAKEDQRALQAILETLTGIRTVVQAQERTVSEVRGTAMVTAGKVVDVITRNTETLQTVLSRLDVLEREVRTMRDPPPPRRSQRGGSE